MRPLLSFGRLHVLAVALFEASSGFANVRLFAFVTVVFIYSFALEGVRFAFVL